MFPIFVSFCMRTNTVEVDSRREVVSSLSFPRLTAVLPETQGGDVRREGVEAFNTMRQMTLDPVKCAAVSVHCWRITDVERTAAYEELRKQWRAESLIAHLTVFKWQTRLMNTKETRTVLLLPRFELFHLSVEPVLHKGCTIAHSSSYSTSLHTLTKYLY